MYALLIEATFKPGTKQEFLNYLTGTITPTERKHSGFVEEIVMFSEANPNLGIGVSVWQSKAEAERYLSGDFKTVNQKIEHLFEKRPTVRGCNVEVGEIFRLHARRAA